MAAGTNVGFLSALVIHIKLFLKGSSHGYRKKRNSVYDVVLRCGRMIGRANSAYYMCDVAVEDGKVRRTGLLLVSGVQQSSSNGGSHLSLPSSIVGYFEKFQYVNERFGLRLDPV